MFEVRRMRATDEELQGLVGRLMSSGFGGLGDEASKFTIFDMNYASESPVKLKVSGQFANGKQYTDHIAADQIIAAFILFCEEGRIPICRESEKTIVRITGGVAFDMVIRNLSIDPAKQTPEQSECTFVHEGCTENTA